MEYFEILFTVDSLTGEQREILIAELGELGFEAFVEDGNHLKAYVPEDLFDDQSLKEMLADFFPNLSYSVARIDRQNWNQTWESQYSPITVDDFCCICAPFHRVEDAFPLKIVIQPKMSFGTGHHQTTRMMIKAMQTLDFTSKRVLDMGCGTGVLAIAASKMGASQVDAVDIDEWAVENTTENCQLNGISNVSVNQGDSGSISDTYDVILANINRNILLRDMNTYATHLQPGGKLILSGFYVSDEDALVDEANRHRLLLASSMSEDGWLCLIFNKLS